MRDLITLDPPCVQFLFTTLVTTYYLSAKFKLFMKESRKTMYTVLNSNIKILSNSPISNSKASETYVSVAFTYGNKIWEGFIPIEYRRTGVFIDFDDKETLYSYLNSVYEEMNPINLENWNKAQREFWKTKPRANTTKSFFDVLAEGGWKCGSCEMPRNNNPQRRIQDLKEFGYTIATDLSRYCPHCGKNTSQRILLPIPRSGNEGNGYETWSPALRKRIIQVLNSFDVYEAVSSPHCLPDHKFSEIRWDDDTKTKNPDDMNDDEIRDKFQLLTNQRNQQKREVCRTCFQTGNRGIVYGIPFFYKGGLKWDQNIPPKGKEAEKGCIGCAWYDIAMWRKELLKKIDHTEQ